MLALRGSLIGGSHAFQPITCPGMHGSSFHIYFAASTAAKNAVSARHPRGPSVGAERRNRASRVPRGHCVFRAERSVAASGICPRKHCTGAFIERAGCQKKFRAPSCVQHALWTQWGRSGGGGLARPDSAWFLCAGDPSSIPRFFARRVLIGEF